MGTAAVCKHGNQWRSRHSYLGMGCMEELEGEQWSIELALDVTIEKREALERHGVKTVAVLSDSQTACGQGVHQDPGLGQ